MMGLNEIKELDEYLDMIVYGKPDDSDAESDGSEIICRCGQGRGNRRSVERTVPRLPQAAIHHRIALMETPLEQHARLNGQYKTDDKPHEGSSKSRRRPKYEGYQIRSYLRHKEFIERKSRCAALPFSEVSDIELQGTRPVKEMETEIRASSPSNSSTGSRRGRGRARTLRDNAAALPSVGRLKKLESSAPHIEPRLEKPEVVDIPRQTQAGNWLQDDFPSRQTQAGNWLQDDFPSLAATKEDRINRSKPDFKEIRKRIAKLQPDLNSDSNNEYVSSEELVVNQDTANGDIQSDMKIEQEPKINQKNFMKQSKLDFQKLLPEGFIVNNYSSKRNKHNKYSSHTYKYNDQHDDMDGFFLNDDIPEYCRYEVTHDDIRRHNEKALKVPETVKGKVNSWLKHLENPVENEDKTGRFDDAEKDKTDIFDVAEKDADCNDNILSRAQNQIHISKKDPIMDDCSGITRPSETDLTGAATAADIVYANNTSTQLPDNTRSDVADVSDVLQFQAQTEAENCASADSDINSLNNDISTEDTHIDNFSQEINKFENGPINDLNATSNVDRHMNQMSNQTNTSNIYFSDEESNVLFEKARTATQTQIKMTHIENVDQRSNVSSGTSACLSESEFVTKYHIENEKKSKNEKMKKISSGSSSDFNNVWRLDGKRVIQVNGLTRNCVVSHLEEMVSSFGTVSDFEQKAYGDKLSVRFKLCDEDACDFAVQCLHDTDCIFPDSNSILECFKVG